MRLEQLQFFLTTAISTSVTKAAEQLYTTPQNVSKSIKLLEAELGVKLFHRFRNGMFLTEDGLRAYEIAENIIQQTDLLKAAFSKTSKPTPYRTASALRMLIPPLFNDMLFTVLNSLLYRGITFSEMFISRMDIRELNEALLSDISGSCQAYDSVITCFDHDEMTQITAQLNQCFVGYLIWQDRVCLEVDQDDALADYPMIPLSLLTTLPLVMYVSNARAKTFTEQAFERRGIALKVPYRIPSENGKRFAQRHHVYSILGTPTNELRPNPGHVLVPIEGNIRSDHCLLIPRSRTNQFPLSEMLRVFDDLFSIKKLF